MPADLPIRCRACLSAACRREPWTRGWDVGHLFSFPASADLGSDPGDEGTQGRAFLPFEAGKTFIFEDKGTTAVTRTRKRPLQTHRIEVGAAQLNWYCDEAEPASMIPVCYVLRQPPERRRQLRARPRARNLPGYLRCGSVPPMGIRQPLH
jgi:hypothetical protein